MLAFDDFFLAIQLNQFCFTIEAKLCLKGHLFESKAPDILSPNPLSTKTLKHIKNIYSTNTTPKNPKRPNEPEKNCKRLLLESRWDENITEFSSTLKAALQMPTLGIYPTAVKPINKTLLGEELW